MADAARPDHHRRHDHENDRYEVRLIGGPTLVIEVGGLPRPDGDELESPEHRPHQPQEPGSPLNGPTISPVIHPP